MNLSISFNSINAGWTNCEIFINGERTILTASYLDDALGNLTEATLKIAEGEKIAHAIFAEEPGEYFWEIAKIDDEEIAIEILWFDEWKGIRQSSDKGESVLRFKCSLLTFVRRIIICLSEVLNEYGLEGYKNKWISHEFPLQNYEKLRNILPKLK